MNMVIEKIKSRNVAALSNYKVNSCYLDVGNLQVVIDVTYLRITTGP